jgi:hypothetical protein
MNQTELAKALGTTQASISNWLGQGMPCRRRGKRTILDLEACRQWAVEHVKPIRCEAAPATAPRGDMVAWLHSAFGRNGVEPAAWLAVEVDIDPAAAAGIWWNCAGSLFSALSIDLGADPLLMPEPAAPDVAAVAARLAEIKATWTE